MPKIAHMADLHLDSPFVMFKNKQASVRKNDLRETFANAVEYALKSKVEIILIAGDMFENEYATIKTAAFIIDVMKRAAEIEFFISPGNHDFFSSDSVYNKYTYPKNVHIFTSSEIKKIELEHLNTVVYGVSAINAHDDRHMLEKFTVEDSGKINIMVCHSMLTNKRGHSLYMPVTKEEIAKTGLDYLALGHIHTYSIEKEGGTVYAYSGCLEGRGFDESGDKGMIIGRVEKGKAELDFVQLSKRKHIIERIDISDCANEYDIKNKISAVLEGYDINVILRIILTGKRKKASVRLSDVLPDEYPVFYLEVKDESAWCEDIREQANDKTLRGIFISMMLKKIDETDEGEKSLYEKALEYGLLALDNEEIGL